MGLFAFNRARREAEARRELPPPAPVQSEVKSPPKAQPAGKPAKAAQSTEPKE